MKHLHVLAMKQGPYWVAQCLQYDLVVQCRCILDLESKLEELLIGHILASERMRIEPFTTLDAAPVLYWDRYEDGLGLRSKETLDIRVELPRGSGGEVKVLEHKFALVIKVGDTPYHNVVDGS